MSFGCTVKELRIGQKKTLREFCIEHGHDPSNWSKIERGMNPPPRDEATLVQWAKELGLKLNTVAWKDFMYQAEVSRGSIPKEIMADETLLEKLPVFFRTIRGAELTEGQLNDFIEWLRETCAPDGVLATASDSLSEAEGVHPVQKETFRGMSPARKLQLVAQFNRDARSLKSAGLRALHPKWSDVRIKAEVRETFLHATG